MVNAGNHTCAIRGGLVDVPGRSSMTKDELVDAIQQANDRKTAEARTQ
jgi:hypothetical protein